MFKQLKIYYVFVSLPYVLLLVGAGLFFEGIKVTITRNPHPQINYTIFVIILLGGMLIFLNCRRLVSEARTIIEFFGAVHKKVDIEKIKAMANSYTTETACLLQMVSTSSERLISHQEQVAIEHELSNTRTSLLRRNALPSYLTGLLVGMGLLGTFIGLLATLNDITVLISSFAEIDMQNANPLDVFGTMIERMKAPMQSMGIAFSASMFGLLGSIILGLMMVGLRRLQGDMFSTLSSEVSRHIEIALSHGSVPFSDGSAEGEGGVGGESSKLLLRIEERYSEAARSQQRAFSSLIDDIQKQRTDLLRALTEQTEASNGSRVELQQLGRQLGDISNVIDKGNSEASAQMSELTVHLSGGDKDTQKLLVQQLDEQKVLRDTLGSYKVEERLAEAARSQQRALSTVIDDMQQQRSEMLRALTEQTEASHNSRSELRNVVGQLDNIFNIIEKGNGEVSEQISELTVHMSADSKEAQLLSDDANANLITELQQLGAQLATQLGGGFSDMGQGNDELCAKISDLMVHMSADAKRAHEQLDSVSTNFRGELQQLGAQLGTSFGHMENGNDEICAKIADLIVHASADAKRAQEQLDKVSENFRSELQKLAGQLGTGFGHMEQGNDEVCAKIADLMAHIGADAKRAREQFETVNKGFQGDLQQLGSQLSRQLGSLSDVTEKGSEELCSRFAELKECLTEDDEVETDSDVSPEDNNQD